MRNETTDWLPPLLSLSNDIPPSKLIATGWQGRLLTGTRGAPLGNVANALTALRHAPEWQGVLYFDQSSLATVAKAPPPFEYALLIPFNWEDAHDVLTAAWLQHQGICVNKEIAAQAVQTVGREHSFHPIRDYLDSLEWDSVGRIDDFLTHYLGADRSEYVRAISAKFLIGGVARIYKPGCKNDNCLILEGPQGILKSTALRVMTDPWFTDEMPELGTKDAAMQCRGPWLIELSELDSMAKVEAGRVKAFISRSKDRFRPPYGRHPIEVPRQCIFAGTVNLSVYLKDETGGRRFWPMRCGTVKIDDLKRDRDQLWAEARERFRGGETWWLDSKHLVAAAVEEQRDRYEDDSWDGLIRAWVEGKDCVAIEDVMEFAIEKPKGEWTQGDKNRVGRSLRMQGWEQYRHRDGEYREYRFRKVHDVPRP